MQLQIHQYGKNVHTRSKTKTHKIQSQYSLTCMYADKAVYVCAGHTHTHTDSDSMRYAMPWFQPIDRPTEWTKERSFLPTKCVLVFEHHFNNIYKHSIHKSFSRFCTHHSFTHILELVLLMCCAWVILYETSMCRNRTHTKHHKIILSFRLDVTLWVKASSFNEQGGKLISNQNKFTDFESKTNVTVILGINGKPMVSIFIRPLKMWSLFLFTLKFMHQNESNKFKFIGHFIIQSNA